MDFDAESPTPTPEPEASDLRAILRPRSVAVIGASGRRGTIGGEIMRNLITHDFQGPVYPVNPRADFVMSVKAFPSIADVPGHVDLAVLAVPQPMVLPVIKECAKKGVRGCIVITAGFKETGDEGVELERQIAEVARASGMRLVGPNCLGVVSTDPDTRLDATFAPTFPPAGTVAIASQSGALGVAMLDYAKELNIGVSDFVSMGNKADVSGNDLLAWWESDPRTRVVLLYLESFGNPQRFARMARRVTRTKPIVAVKSGRSRRGLMAASSHTGSLAGADVAVEALVEATGIIRVDTVDELFDMAAFLAHQPAPRGRRVAILTNAGGPGILATDAAASKGLDITDLPEAVRAELATFLPPAASLSNPVDMIASATPAQFERATRVLLECDAVDSLIVLFVPPIVTDPTLVGQAIANGASGIDKPVISCFMGRHGVPEALRSLHAAHIPSYAFPESAVRVLARACEYAEWREREVGTLPKDDALDLPAIRTVVDAALARMGEGGGWLNPSEVEALLAGAGVHWPETRFAATAGEAASHARAMGFPVVLKLVAEGVEHKSDVGGVKVDLRNEAEVFSAFEAIVSDLRAHGLQDRLKGVLVQRLVKSGVEVIIGMTRDPAYGPLVMFGLGGVHVELLKDVRFRFPPLTDADAARLVRSVRGFPLLDGHRGAPKADVAALESLLARISAIGPAIPELMELDLNPVMVQVDDQGCVAVDARVRLVPVAD